MTSRLRLMGIEVDPITIPELNVEVGNMVASGEKGIIANHNLHSVYLISRQPELLSFWEHAKKIHIDGMPLIWWGKLLGYSLNRKHRVTYLDWIYPLMDLADQKSWRVFYLGSKDGVAEKAVDVLSNEYPNIQFQTHHGYFDTSSEENSNLVKQIYHFNPHILMVGMGMPRQERWIMGNISDINSNVILNCGACFDYIAGEQKSPPRILGQLGLEWLYRFLTDPFRLFKRYFIEPILLIPRAIDDLRQRNRI